MLRYCALRTLLMCAYGSRAQETFDLAFRPGEGFLHRLALQVTQGSMGFAALNPSYGARAARRMFALCAGMPVSSKQTRASAATPLRMSSLEGSAKHRRMCDVAAAGSHAQSGPGLKAMPAVAAGSISFRTSIASGSLIHKKMPPFGRQASTAVPNSFASA